MAWVLEHSQARGSARCVLISIANHVGPDGTGWVHVRRVCAEANCSHGTYARAVQEAEARGELRREVHGGGSARMHDAHRPNLWTFPALAGEQPETPVRQQPDRGPSEAATTVFEAWVDATGRDRARARLTAQRRKKVDARLREGYDVNELVSAVRGISLSAWHRGDNDNRVRYDDLTVALRDGSQVERFAALWEQRHERREDPHPVTGKRERGCSECDNGFVMHDDGSVSVCSCPGAGDEL